MIILTPGFASDEQDFNCIPALQLLVKDLLRQGQTVNVIALEYPFSNQPYGWHGAKVFPCNGQNRRWLRLRTVWRAMVLCRDILDKHPSSPPLLLSFWLGWASWVGERLARRHGGLLHFTTLMGQDVLPSNRRFFFGLSAERCSRLIAVSDFQHEKFYQSTGFHAGQVIPWGMDASEAPDELSAPRSLDVLGAGSLIAVKNWDKWLRTLARVVAQKPELKVELIGSGPQRERLEQIAKSLKIAGNVLFTGALPRPEVLDRMRRAKVLLHTADFESYGFVLAEAAMCGARVVSTPVGIAPQIGAKCASDAEQLATLLLSTLAEPDSTEGTMCFNMEKTAEQYRRLGRESRV